MRRWFLVGVAAVVGGFLVIQVIPYGRDHTNPPVVAEPAWDSQATRGLVVTACFDCHSNETVWPWYSNIAPISWRLQNHVTEGREKLNFSEWGTGEQETEKLAEVVQDGEMPPWDYLLTHPEARLSDADRQALIDGLDKTFGGSGSSGSGEGDD
ncbi:MAG TPA: heme-binding domain-containing protein [Candidatus Limnocylindrales bacterium]|nr:heme-binding domain-containing protein [Candidatus Limnocylindrales bacterium]